MPVEPSAESRELEQHNTSRNPGAFPWILWCYEVCILAAWTFVIIKYRHDIEHTYLIKGTWSLYISIPLSVVVGSISATSFAIYGMYKHQIQRNFAINFVAWYVSKPIVGGIMGGFIGIISTVILNSFGADTVASHATFIGISFLAGSNDEFTAKMIEKFANQVLGGRSKDK